MSFYDSLFDESLISLLLSLEFLKVPSPLGGLLKAILLSLMSPSWIWRTSSLTLCGQLMSLAAVTLTGMASPYAGLWSEPS